MKRITLFFLLVFCTAIVMAQTSKIENTRLSLSTTADSLIVKYDLTGKYPAFNVKLEVTDSLGITIPAISLSGDVGNNVNVGVDRTIYWNMNADKANVYGSLLFAKVTANIAIPAKVKTQQKIWIPWLYIAAGASAATGMYAHMKANSIYDNYSPSSQTVEAERYHADVKKFDTIRNVAFGAAGALGIAAIVVHVKHNQKKNAIAISYVPISDGAVFGLTCNF